MSSQMKHWLSTWQSFTQFQELPTIPGIIAVISGNHDKYVIFTTHLSPQRLAEDAQCQFGNLASLLSVFVRDFRILFWACPTDGVVSAQLDSLTEKLVKELQPRLTTNNQSKQNSKALPAEIIHPEVDELMV